MDKVIDGWKKSPIIDIIQIDYKEDFENGTTPPGKDPSNPWKCDKGYEPIA